MWVVRDHDNIEVKGKVVFYLVSDKKSSWGLAEKASGRWMASLRETIHP